MDFPEFCREDKTTSVSGFWAVGIARKAAPVASKSLLLSAFFCILLAPIPGQAQDPQPSLADIARQARKDKEKNATKPKTVITNEGLPSSGGSSSGSGLTGLAAGDANASPNSGGGDPMGQALARFDQAESELKNLDAMDRPTLVKAVLIQNDVPFPNRQDWEARLFAAKVLYATRGRELIRELKQIMGDLQSLKESQAGAKLSPDDPRIQQMKQRLQEIMQDATRTEEAYRSVVKEGVDLAKQASH